MEKTSYPHDASSYSGRELADSLERQIQIDKFRPQDAVASFETDHGSVYTYDQDGRTTRFKTATGELKDAQDITVFVELTQAQQQAILLAYRQKNEIPSKVYVVENTEEEKPRIIRSINDVKRPDELFLAIYQPGKIRAVAASLFPTINANVFDTRHFEQDGVMMTERHLGNKVSKITPRR